MAKNPTAAARRLTRRSRWLLAAAALCVAAIGVGAQGRALSGRHLVDSLQRGGYVLVMRHAAAPQEKPDPAMAESDNPRLERQLDQAGKESARAMGGALRALKIPIGEVLSSPTYRAFQTARLAGLPEPQPAMLLSDGGKGMQADVDNRRAAWLRDQVAKAPAAGTNTILITHLPNIAGAFGDGAQGLEDGEAMVFHPDLRGHGQLVGRIKIGDWPHLAAAN